MAFRRINNTRIQASLALLRTLLEEVTSGADEAIEWLGDPGRVELSTFLQAKENPAEAGLCRLFP